jgi:protein-tyrosine phosphatase
MRSIYFVCEGNIYRSPFAAAAFAAAMPAGFGRSIKIASGGFVGPGRPSPLDAIEAARRFGIDLRSHRSTLLHEAMREDWDVVVVMEPRQARALMRSGLAADRILVLGDLDPHIADRRTIADPWQQDPRILSESYRRIDRCIRELVRAVTGSDQPIASRNGSADGAAFSS